MRLRRKKEKFMLNAYLYGKKTSVKLTIKGALAFFCVALSVALPQIAHAAGGASAGATYLPMYGPVLLAGCLLGWSWGLGTGIIAPVVSFGLTSLTLGSAMPAAARLPLMIAELAVFGAVGGLFSKPVGKNALYAFPAVLCAQLAGRAVYVIYNLIAGVSPASVFASVAAGLPGTYIQLILIPAIAIILSYALGKHAKR